MKTVVVIDFKCIYNIALYSILNGKRACMFPTQEDEMKHRLFGILTCTRFKYPEAKIILANDTKPYWREGYMNKWYLERNQETVLYKGNRLDKDWVFQSTEEDMESAAGQVKISASRALDFYVIEDMGLEADDVWGLLVKQNDYDNLIGLTTDSDWAQLCGDKVAIEHPLTGELSRQIYDIRIKYVAGDPGDNILGCQKTAKTRWAEKGVKNLLVKDNWYEGLDKEVLDRNYVLTTLPCPLWNLEQSLKMLEQITSVPKPCNFFDEASQYGYNEKLIEELKNEAAQDSFMDGLRSRLKEKFDAKI